MAKLQKANQRTPIQRPHSEEPPKMRVLLHNDDFTTMDFVVELLKTVFRKSDAEAESIMLAVHREGKGVAGIYLSDIAKTKADKGTRMAREAGFPLKLTCEPV